MCEQCLNYKDVWNIGQILMGFIISMALMLNEVTRKVGLYNIELDLRIATMCD